MPYVRMAVLMLFVLAAALPMSADVCVKCIARECVNGLTSGYVNCGSNGNKCIQWDSCVSGVSTPGQTVSLALPTPERQWTLASGGASRARRGTTSLATRARRNPPRPMTAAALLSILLTVTPGVTGELCLHRSDRTLPTCAATTGRRFAIERSDAPRFAIWWNRDGTEAAVGAIEATASAIDLTSGAWQPVAIELRATTAVTLTVRAPNAAAATLTIPPHRAASLRRLWLPASDASLTFEAEHHEPVAREVQRGTTTLGVIALKALPLLTGSVVAAEDDGPLPYVTVTAGGSSATSDSLGRFRLWVAGDWPELVRITAPGRAPADVAVPKIVASADLGRIRLGSGGTLRLGIGERRVEVRLLRRIDRTLHEVAIRPEVSGTADFAPLASGSYVIVLRGAQPLQQLALPAEVRDGETTGIEARIEPAALSLAVRRRDEGVGASIAIKPASGEWQTAITTGNDGRYEGELWQRGEFISFVTAGATTAARHDRLEGTRQIEWTIELPHLQIAGTVTDASGKPIAGAEVTLDTVSADASTQTAETTDANGRFVFRGVEAGQQTLTAAADGYLPSTLTFPLTEDYAATIRLQRGVRRTLIVTHEGRPAANAIVLDESGASGEQRTDAGGAVEITLAPGEQKAFYVLPAGGSFGVAEVRGGSEVQRIDVPAGAATIRITAASDEGEPVRGMSLAIRYNGRMLTPWVRAMLRNRRGVPLVTGADGVATLTAMPAGLFEIWPYFRADELPRIESGLVPPRARIAVQPGLNEVRFTFEPQNP